MERMIFKMKILFISKIRIQINMNKTIKHLMKYNFRKTIYKMNLWIKEIKLMIRFKKNLIILISNLINKKIFMIRVAINRILKLKIKITMKKINHKNKFIKNKILTNKL